MHPDPDPSKTPTSQDAPREPPRPPPRPQPAPPTDPVEVERLLHDLSVHQIELELQNESLRQAQEALESSRDRYVDLYDNAPVAYISFRPRGLIAHANRRAAALLGARNVQQLVGQRVDRHLLAADQPVFHALLAALLQGRESAAGELRLAAGTADAPPWVSMQMALVREPGGELQVRAALVDISERLQLQHDLARLAAIVEFSEDAIVGRDLEGRVTSWNEAAARLFGAPREAMLGRTMAAQLPAEREKEEVELLRRMRRGERVQHFETERVGAGGVRLPVSMSLSPLPGEGGRAVGSAMIARDISARQQADRALARRLRQLDLLSRAGQALIMGEPAAPAGGDVFAQLAQALGADIHLRHETDAATGALRATAAQGAEGDAAEAGAALAEQVAAQGGELVIADLAASDLPAARRLRAAGARCYAGFALGARHRAYGVAAFASTTREGFADDDLQTMRSVCAQVSAMLERARLLDELHDRERSLQRADRAKDEFIATLAHELRNPLAPIRNALAILRRAGPGDAQQVAWCRDIIDRQVVQMTRLLEDLLDVSRVTRNKIELRRDRLDLMRAVEQALEMTRPLIESQGHRLRLELPDEPVLLYGDLTRLTQVFANLLNNAAKYTDPGGELLLKVERLGAQARITVRDTGIGIDPAQLPGVFEMFAQHEPAIDRSAGGLGIGLALTRGLVELHGGSVQAHSAGLARGSEFVVLLPLASDHRHAVAAAPQPRDAEPLPARRVLVVDDNADVGQSMAALLSLYGQEVRVAGSGAEGLRIATQWRPDCALLDIGMPDLNGYELCRRIRAEPWGRDVVIVACTGWGQADDRARAAAAGFDHHLVKPIATEALLALLAAPPAPRPPD